MSSPAERVEKAEMALLGLLRNNRRNTPLMRTLRRLAPHIRNRKLKSVRELVERSLPDSQIRNMKGLSEYGLLHHTNILLENRKKRTKKKSTKR